jgi:hypothetical protein
MKKNPMNIKPIQAKLKLLLLGVLCASALNVFAASIDITEDTAESNKSYDDSDTTTQAALNVTNGVTYNGTGIILTTTNAGPEEDEKPLNNSPIGKGAYVNNATLSLTGGTVSTTGSWGFGINLINTSSGTVNNVNIATTADRGKGIYVANTSALTLTGGTITAQGFGGHGVTITGTSSGVLNNVNIRTDGDHGYGVLADYGSTLALTSGTVTTTNVSGHGIMLTSGSDSSTTIATVSNVNIQTEGNGAYGVYVNEPDGQSNTILTLTDSNIRTTGNSAFGVALDNAVSGTVSGMNVETTGVSSHGVFAVDGTPLTIADSDVRVTGSLAFALAARGGSATTELNNNTLSGTGIGGGSIYAFNSGSINLTGSNGSLITGNVRAFTGGTVDITITTGSELHGNFLQDANAASVINLTVGAGALLEGGGELDSLTLENGAVIGYTGLLTVTDSIEIGGTVTIDFSNLTATGEYNLLNWSGATESSPVTADQFNIVGTGVEGTFAVQNGQLTFNASAIPEPSTWFLLGAGLGLLLLAARYRHRQARTDA